MSTWNDLAKHQRATDTRHMLELFAEDANRAADFSIRAGEMLLDYSKTNIDATCRDMLIALAQAQGVAAKRDAMFAREDQRDRGPRRAAYRAARR